MRIDLERVRHARKMFDDGPESLGPSLAHDLAGLLPLLQLAAQQDQRFLATHEAVSALQDDLVSLLTLIARIQWQHELRVQGEMSEGIWLYFTRLDIEYFFVVLRSAFDHIAVALKSVALKPKQAPDDFHKMSKRATSERGPSILGDDICAFVEQADWFSDVRDWRDSITHRGAWALSFFDDRSIPFQIFGRRLQRLVPPELTRDENVVDFRRLGAFLLADFVLYLDALDDLIRKLARLRPVGPITFTCGPGTQVLRVWLDELLIDVGDHSFPQPSG